MQPKDIFLNDNSFQKLLHNDSYYKHIFKKTEKIVSVVFYIIQQSVSDKKSETHTSNLASKAHFVHENALRTLEVKSSAGTEVLEQFAQALIGLDSTIRVVTTAGVIPPEVASVVTAEIDTVLRSLRSYLSTENGTVLSMLDNTGGKDNSQQSLRQPRRPTAKRAVGSPLSSTPSSEASTPSSDTSSDRRTRIYTVLEAKGEATIKDISEIVTDVSEKTIQRDLNAMIEAGDVQRQGERRWSRYSIVS